MNCSDWEGRIALYAGRDLDAAESLAVERHVADCAGCRIFLGGLRECLNLLREGRGEPIEEVHLTAVRAGVMAELPGARTPWWRQVWVYGAIAAAVLVFVLARPSPQRLSKVAKAIETPAVVVQAEQQPEPRPKPKRRRAVRPPSSTETVLVKLETNDPDLVIYWITETKGETK